MPSPLGHAMAGAMAAWIGQMRDRRSGQADPGHERRPAFLDRVAATVTPLTVACAALAVSPDFDTFFHTHRTYTHSLGAAGIVWVLVALVAWRWRLPVVRTATICAAAYASHVLLDWLGRDDSRAGGLMALWPLSAHYYRSGLDLFYEFTLLHRRHFNLVAVFARNAHALAHEMMIIAPPFLVTWLAALLTLGRRSHPADGAAPREADQPALRSRSDSKNEKRSASARHLTSREARY